MYIELKNINKSFGDFQASKDVNFAIEKGKLVGLLGPSGSGKTTILRMLAGLEHQDSGASCSAFFWNGRMPVGPVWMFHRKHWKWQKRMQVF